MSYAYFFVLFNATVLKSGGKLFRHPQMETVPKPALKQSQSLDGFLSKLGNSISRMFPPLPRSPSPALQSFLLPPSTGQWLTQSCL